MENKDISGTGEDEDAKKGYGFEDTVVSGPIKKNDKKAATKPAGGPISFGKPTFGRKEKKF